MKNNKQNKKSQAEIQTEHDARLKWAFFWTYLKPGNDLHFSSSLKNNLAH